ncbi:MAG: serine/threonine protein kinase [Gemmataceae bacterium]|nr:serine/threonine protein kinase [Gemmataceae bacterium]
MALALEDFLKTVQRSGLLGPEQLQSALKNIPAPEQARAEAVAQRLVQFGLLTQFQANKLLQGASIGLQLGPYRILTPIGKGGMGMVYLGLDQRSKQHVAIKVLSPQRRREGDRHLIRFRRELEISKKLLHPHLVVAQDVGEEHQVHYLVMEYIPGQTLHRLVTTEGPLTVPRAARLFREVADALHYAHSQGLIHRDLKPANIMVTPNDHAKVLDLGLAIFQGETVDDAAVLGGRGHVVGTFDYIAPEQTRDAAKVDPRADVYALGCSLYFALSGRPPFPTGTAKEKIQAHRTQEPQPLRELNPSVPEEFAAIVRQMMAKTPEQRLTSMAVVQTALAPWVGHELGKPLDQTGDSAFQAAVAALQSAPVIAEPSDEPWAFLHPERRDVIQRHGAASRHWLLAGTVVAWLLAFALLVVIFLLG